MCEHCKDEKSVVRQLAQSEIEEGEFCLNCSGAETAPESEPIFVTAKHVRLQWYVDNHFCDEHKVLMEDLFLNKMGHQAVSLEETLQVCGLEDRYEFRKINQSESAKCGYIPPEAIEPSSSGDEISECGRRATWARFALESYAYCEKCWESGQF